MIIRKANILDLSVLVEHGEKFLKFIFPDKAVDKGNLMLVLDNLVRNHIVFIAENGGEFYGTIGGLLINNMWYPDQKELNELFWWVSPKHRGSSAGLRLMKHWIEYGKSIGANVVMSQESISPLSEDAYIKRGFELKEKTYLMEV